jgi:hypothetical protein
VFTIDNSLCESEPVKAFLKNFVSLASLSLILYAPAALAAPQEWPDDAWLKVAAENGGLQMSVSDDGKQWRALEQTFIKAANGKMLNPRLQRGTDGIFHLAWETGGKGRAVAYASSADLVHWSKPQYLASLDKLPAAMTQAPGATLWIPPWMVQELAAAKPAAPGAQPVPAPRPALDGFTADPSIRVFGDTYYLYPTSDKPHWQTTDFSVWTSKNLVDWKKENMVLDVVHDLKWGNIEAWAPDAIERNGKYYFYFCAKGEIGVATAASPLGPFVDALGGPLLRKGSGIDSNTIDPYPFIDDNGQAYLYYGNGRLANVYKLKPDMVTLDGPAAAIELPEFREGIVVFKRAGKYYFMWSIDDARSPNYRVGWGVADSPLGPVRAPAGNFIVLQRHGAAVGTAHHSVVNVPGTDRWYVAYHRHALPQGGGYQRETVLARMEFDSAGNIKPIDPLTAPFKPGDIGEPIVDGKGLQK